MLTAKYAFLTEHKQNDGYTLHMDIDAVQLGLMRITDPRERSAGMLVPVWDFIGTTTVTQPNGIKTDESLRQCLLTINAIDGSVIDRELGY